MKDILCRSCGLRCLGSEIPQGWYFLSVGDKMAKTGRGYRYLGLFCSIACLANHMPDMAKIEQEIQLRLEMARSLS